MNQRPRSAVVLIAVLVICVVGVFLVVNRPERQIDEPGASPRARGEGPAEKAELKHPGGRPTPQDQWPAESKPTSPRNPQIKSFRAYFRMTLGVPWGSSTGWKKSDDGLEGVTKAALALARIRKREAVEFAARLCEVLRKHKLAIPRALADSVKPEHTHGLPNLSLDDHEAVLTEAALVVWIASWNDRDAKHSDGGLKLEVAWDLLTCVAVHCPVGFVRPAAAHEMVLLALCVDPVLPLDSDRCAAQALAVIDGIWADALDVSDGRWTIDSAATLFSLEMVPVQFWLMLKAISMDQVTEASLTRFVDDLSLKVRGLRQAELAEGTDEVIQDYLDRRDDAIREEIPPIVQLYGDKKEVEALVRALQKTLAANEAVQRSLFGHKCKTVDLLWYRISGSVRHRDVHIVFQGGDANGKVSPIPLDREIRRTPAGLRWD